MPYRIDPNTGQPVWDGTSIPQASRDSLSTQIRELQAQIDALSFIDLDDVPATYTGQSGKILSVKSAENGLEFITNSGGAGVTDGDKGDVVVTGTGTVWTIDTGAITTAKIADGQVTVAKTSGFGSIATQASSSVTITGGSITGITDLAIADGGTGASTAENARTNLGLGGAAVLAVGTTAGTVAAGDDARFHSAAFVASSLQSVMDFSGQNLEAVTTPAADRIVFFDQSIGSWEYLTLGTGLSITGQTISVTATGTNTIFRFFPRDAEFPSTGFATIDTRNNHPCLDYADSGTETAFFTGFIPQGASFATSGTALTFVLESTAESALNGNIGWLVALERIVANGIDIDSDAFGTAQPGSAAVIGGANTGKVAEVSVTFTLAQLPSLLAAGDMIRVRVQRNTAVSGNHAGDAELLGLYANMTPVIP